MRFSNHFFQCCRGEGHLVDFVLLTTALCLKPLDFQREPRELLREKRKMQSVR